MDCYLTMIAKWTVKDKKIDQVGFVPAYLPEDGAPYVVKPSDPKFKEICDYMVRITKGQNMDPDIYHIDGDWVKLK